MPKPILVKPEPLIKEPDLSFIMKCQAEFNKAYEVSKDAATQELYIDLLDEEHEEWIEEYYTVGAKDFDELKELTDLLYVAAGLAFVKGYDLTKAESIQSDNYDDLITEIVSDIVSGTVSKKVISNLIYAIFSYAYAMKWNIDEAYRRVHLSNLSKLGDDGRPVRRSDGKVLKGPNYKPPYLEDLTDGN